MRQTTLRAVRGLDVLLTFALWSTPCFAADPQPVSVAFGTNFLGYDGQWSPVSVRVGSPDQWLSLFPSTTGQETWVVGPAGCDGTLTCQTQRGGLFFSNQSSTFASLGYFDAGYSALTGTTQYGDYGFDNVTLSDEISAANQIINIVNSTDTWVGELGLGVQETRFENNINHPSFLSSLVQNYSVVPSHSYGYTAGAYYRLKSIPGSLTLGGVDRSRFTPNDVSFTLSQGYIPVVAVNSIIITSSPPSGSMDIPPNWNVNPVTVVQPSQAALFTIDTSTPFLWLPEAVCDNIASALNLTYDDTLQLYLFGNSSSPESLSAWGLNFAFTVANSPGSTQTLDLTIPYEAFNHQLTYPFPGLDANFSSAPTNYFPLRRANSTDQYIIGRAFLQETYLTVDYERNNFSLSQAVFSDAAVVPPQLLAIPRPPGSTWPGPLSSDTGLSTGAKAGIGVGAAILVITILVLLWVFCIRKRKDQEVTEEKQKRKRRSLLSMIMHKDSSSEDGPSELIGDKRHPMEMVADSSNTRFELASDSAIEMPAGEVAPAFYAVNNQGGGLRNSTISRNDPRCPAELAPTLLHRSSISKDNMVGEESRSEGSSSPAPAYSPNDIGQQRNSSSISPYSARHSNAFGTLSSGEQGISPVGSSPPGTHSTLTSQFGKSQPSPVSPVVASSTRLGRQLPAGMSIGTQPRSLSGSGNGSNGSQAAFLAPQDQSQTQLPSRSVSRNSRFREEGLFNDEGATTSESGRRPSMSRPRFSWEEQ